MRQWAIAIEWKEFTQFDEPKSTSCWLINSNSRKATVISGVLIRHIFKPALVFKEKQPITSFKLLHNKKLNHIDRCFANQGRKCKVFQPKSHIRHPFCRIILEIAEYLKAFNESWYINDCTESDILFILECNSCEGRWRRRSTHYIF